MIHKLRATVTITVDYEVRDSSTKDTDKVATREVEWVTKRPDLFLERYQHGNWRAEITKREVGGEAEARPHDTFPERQGSDEEERQALPKRPGALPSVGQGESPLRCPGTPKVLREAPKREVNSIQLGDRSNP